MRVMRCSRARRELWVQRHSRSSARSPRRHTMSQYSETGSSYSRPSGGGRPGSLPACSEEKSRTIRSISWRCAALPASIVRLCSSATHDATSPSQPEHLCSRCLARAWPDAEARIDATSCSCPSTPTSSSCSSGSGGSSASALRRRAASAPILSPAITARPAAWNRRRAAAAAAAAAAGLPGAPGGAGGCLVPMVAGGRAARRAEERSRRTAERQSEELLSHRRPTCQRARPSRRSTPGPVPVVTRRVLVDLRQCAGRAVGGFANLTGRLARELLMRFALSSSYATDPR